MVIEGGILGVLILILCVLWSISDSLKTIADSHQSE